ncbi:MAG TPA: hypothetical protein VGI03_11675 [Verrucomicrobiae bacterium]|jgi:hypothetical protein
MKRVIFTFLFFLAVQAFSQTNFVNVTNYYWIVTTNPVPVFQVYNVDNNEWYDDGNMFLAGVAAGIYPAIGYLMVAGILAAVHPKAPRFPRDE